MTDKEKYEMMNLRNRIQCQREEIKRLRAEIDKLKEMCGNDKPA